MSLKKPKTLDFLATNGDTSNMAVKKTKLRGKEVFYVPYYVKGERHRKYFGLDSEKDAISWDSKYNGAKQKGLAAAAMLTDAQALDAKAAIAILPAGRTLLESVVKAWEGETDASLSDYIERFIKMKGSIGISQKHHKIIENRLKNLSEHFKTFAAITPQSIYAFLSMKGPSRKTLGEWFNTCNEFFKYCVRLDAIKVNPIAKWTVDDFGRKKVKAPIEFIEVNAAKEFLRQIKKQYPQYLKYYVLAMFSGIRVSEILRMTENMLDYSRKEILLPAGITKERKSEHLSDFEPNLWAWLEVCKGDSIVAPSSNTRRRIFKRFGLTQNFARHSFATYHYSLYRDSKRTAALTHHTEEVLKNNYMGALVSEQMAKSYFSIMPNF